MKNEAPEKIYLLPRQGGDYAPYWKTDSQDGFGIEYVRTNAFIEKIEKWLNEHADNDDYTWYDEIEHTSGVTDKFIEDLKNYMKG